MFIKNKLKEKNGSEILQVLIVVAVMGAFTLSAVGILNGSLTSSSNSMINNIDNNVAVSGATVGD